LLIVSLHCNDQLCFSIPHNLCLLLKNSHCHSNCNCTQETVLTAEEFHFPCNDCNATQRPEWQLKITE
jgi:hypothetical protein